jgi:hypothetical protein
MGLLETAINQYGKETFQKFTYSLNPNDPLALSMSKQIEKVIRNALEPLQQEGQRIQRTQRTADSNGRRNTDYYIKSEYASIAQKAVDNFIQKSAAQRKTNIDAHISDVTPATFRTQTAAILDANVRAEIGRMVNQNGGFFSTDKNGLSHWGVEGSLQTEGSKGTPVNLSTSLARRVSSANRAHRNRWEYLLFAATGQRMGYNDFLPEERDAMAKGAKPIVDRKSKINNPELVKADIATKTELSTLERAEKDALIYSRPDLLPQNYIASTAQGRHDLKRIRQKEQRNLYTLEDEKEDTYERLAQAGRRARLVRRYESEHPDDPRVADRRNKRSALKRLRREKERKAAIKRGGRIVAGTILALIGLAVKSLAKMYTALMRVGDLINEQTNRGLQYNLPGNTMEKYLSIERSLASRGLKEGDFSTVFGSVLTKLSSVITGEMPGTLDKFAPFLTLNGTKPINTIIDYTVHKKGTVEDVFKTVINDVLLSSVRGRTDTARDGGLSFNRALADNAAEADKLFHGLGKIVLAVGGLMEKDPVLRDAALKSGDIFGYITAMQETPGTKTDTPLDDSRAQEVTDTWSHFTATLADIRDGILTRILTTLEPVIGFLRQIVKAVLSNPLFEGRYAETVAGMDLEDFEANNRNLARLEIDRRFYEEDLNVRGKALGFSSLEEGMQAARLFEETNAIPAAIRPEQAAQFRVYATYIKGLDHIDKKIGEIETSNLHYASGVIGKTNLVTATTHAAIGAAQQSYLMKEGYESLSGTKIDAPFAAVQFPSNLKLPEEYQDKATYEEQVQEAKRVKDYLQDIADNPGIILSRYGLNGTFGLMADQKKAGDLLAYLKSHTNPQLNRAFLAANSQEARRAAAESVARMDTYEAIVNYIRSSAAHDIPVGAFELQGGFDEGARDASLTLVVKDYNTGKVIKELKNFVLFNRAGITMKARDMNIDVQTILNAHRSTPPMMDRN